MIVQKQTYQLYAFLWLTIIIVVIARYYRPIVVPEPMHHPLKYRVVAGTFALVLDLVRNNSED
jgi:hypothetical protein